MYVTYDQLCRLHDVLVADAEATSWLHPVKKLTRNVQANTINRLLNYIEDMVKAEIEDEREEAEIADLGDRSKDYLN